MTATETALLRPCLLLFQAELEGAAEKQEEMRVPALRQFLLFWAYQNGDVVA